MILKPNKLILIGLIALLGTFAWVRPLQAITRFSDIKGHWAEEAVLTSYCCDLIKGYPDNSYKPEQPLSQLEALVLFMKTQGYELDKTKPAKNKSSVRNPAVPIVPWGQNYLDTAVEKQLLSREWTYNFVYDAPASRVQVALLLGSLLNLPNDAATLPGEGFFSDLDGISPQARAYIVGLNYAEIMNGFPDNTFRPHQSIKRAEAAALLNKLNQGGWVKYAKGRDERQMEGWVSQLTLVGKKAELELTSLQGVQKLKLDPELVCFRAGRECFHQEAVNSQVRLYLNNKKQVGIISILEKIKTPPADEYITGTVKSVVLGEDSLLILSDLDCRDRRLPLARQARLESLKAQNKGFTALKPDTFVKVYLADDMVVRVSELKTESIAGMVEKISARTLYLEDKGSSKKDKPTWFNYWDRARIVDKNGQRMGTVLRGDKVKVTYLDPIPDGIDDEIPLEIKITSRSELKKVKGQVERIINQPGNKAVILKKNKSYPADNNVTVTDAVAGTTISFTDLNPGQEIEMYVDGAGVVMRITRN